MQNELDATQSSQSGDHGNLVTGDLGNSAGSIHDNLIPMGEHSSFNFALAIAWVVALLAVLATLYFWWMSKNTIDIVAEKQTKLESIQEQIKAPAMVKAEKDSNDFKTSVGILSKAKKDRFSITEFLPNFYSKITNDVRITSFALSTEGALAIAGTTQSYRTTADLVLALKSWSTLSNVDLVSVSMSTGDEAAGKPVAAFSITAKLVKTPVAPTSASASASTATGVTAVPAASGAVAQPSTGGTQ